MVRRRREPYLSGINRSATTGSDLATIAMGQARDLNSGVSVAPDRPSPAKRIPGGENEIRTYKVACVYGPY